MIKFYKKIPLTIAGVLLGMNAFSQCIVPADKAVTPANTNVICNGSGTITVKSTETGIHYYLMNDWDNSIVGGPVAGTGNDISLNTNTVSYSTTFNVSAVSSSNYGIDLPAQDDYVRFGSPFTSYSDEITIESWVNFNNNQFQWAGQALESTDDMSTNVWLWHAGTFYVNNGGNWISLDFPTAPSGWVHVATVADADGMYIYYNGILVASNNNGITSGIVNSTGSAIYLGQDPRYPSDQGRNTRTAFDNFTVWNVARTNNDISSNMYTCYSGTETGLVQYTRFDEGSGNTISSLAGSNGTLVNPSDNWVPGYFVKMTTKSTVTVNSISDQTITPAQTSFMCSGNQTITVASTEASVNYYLRNNANDSIVDGPIAGTGSAINLKTGTVNSTSFFHVYAEGPSLALSFNGIDTKVVVPDNPTYNVGTGDFTVEAMVNFTASQPDYAGIVAKGYNGAFYQLVLVQNKLAAEINDGSSMAGVGNGLIGSTDLNDGKWHHVALVVDRASTTAKLYVDGVVEATVTNSLIGKDLTSSEDLIIGAERGSNIYFNGKIDQVHIWNIALTATEIKSNQTTCLIGDENGLLAYYKFDEGTGTTLYDYTGNGNDGYFVNINEITGWTIGVNNCGCSVSMSTMPMITITSPDVSLTQTGNTLTANASGATYKWMDCTSKTLINGETSQSYTPTATGNYALIITQNNCTDTSACKSVTVTGITSNSNIDSQISIYPNPNNGAFVIKSNGEEDYAIINSYGQLIQTVKVSSATNYSVEINNLDKGVYFIVSMTDNQIIRQKIVVMK